MQTLHGQRSTVRLPFPGMPPSPDVRQITTVPSQSAWSFLDGMHMLEGLTEALVVMVESLTPSDQSTIPQVGQWCRNIS